MVIKKNKKITGYSIYNKAVKERTIDSPLSVDKFYPDLPKTKFDVIYADPPWHYNGKLQFDKTSKDQESLDLSRKIFISTPGFKYPTLKTEKLKQIPIQNIANDNCILFMWTSNPHLAQAIELGKAWGFEYRTVAFVWNKGVHNPGKYTLSYCELCLLFKRGKIPTPRGARNVKQIINVPRGKHSEKPKEVREGIEAMFPQQKRIELFAREKITKWNNWGLHLDHWG
jgi:N6-adenosine-specific RNA methylase IME4